MPLWSQTVLQSWEDERWRHAGEDIRGRGGEEREDVLIKSREEEESAAPPWRWAASASVGSRRCSVEGWTEGLWFSSGSQHLKASHLLRGVITSCSWRLSKPTNGSRWICCYAWQKFRGFFHQKGWRFCLVFSFDWCPKLWRTRTQERHRFLLELRLLRGKIIHSKHCRRGDGNDWVTLGPVLSADLKLAFEIRTWATTFSERGDK